MASLPYPMYVTPAYTYGRPWAKTRKKLVSVIQKVSHHNPLGIALQHFSRAKKQLVPLCNDIPPRHACCTCVMLNSLPMEVDTQLICSKLGCCARLDLNHEGQIPEDDDSI
eukprot:CAMPEP_0115715418 /NCGR_PEP_ID=MMETSP0272-20121206/75775_1 /TAXON_ID=71861 /ORGANISM="Scrippsiella trochoidea, Strain CCMP3099" /LENGTH=110 /DNA_ID=CAMNT_0003157655 /DNA_START=107 /DNA_END=439 /DNA_ORIENTATION=+